VKTETQLRSTTGQAQKTSTLDTIFYAAVVAIGILSGRLACGNGNEKTLVLQWTNKKSKARKNKLIVANQVYM
jgi:hypothetical protein